MPLKINLHVSTSSLHAGPSHAPVGAVSSARAPFACMCATTQGQLHQAMAVLLLSLVQGSFTFYFIQGA